MRRLLLALLATAVFACAAPAAAATKLWVVFDGNTSTCKSKVDAFFKCVLDQTNFNALAQKYNNGEPLTLAGSATLKSWCSETDFQCMVNDTGFALTPYDVLLRFYGTSWGGGTNGMRTLTVNGQSMPINVAWVQGGANCDGQTCTGAHEAFEAATDGVSADCCNGQYGHASCKACQSSCAKFDGNGGNPPWGCYSMSCGGATYKMELLSDPSKASEYSASSCVEVTVQGCGGGGTALNQPCSADSDCCSGLVCHDWDYDGQPPYSAHCCKDSGQGCSANTDCCGGMNCTSGKCACVPDGQWCLNAGECCGSDACDTTAHKCVPATTGSGGAAGSGSAGASGAAGAATGGAGGGWVEAGVDAGGAGSAGHDAGPESGTQAAAASTDSSCSCAIPGQRGTSGAALLAGLGLAISLCRRRRRA